MIHSTDSVCGLGVPDLRPDTLRYCSTFSYQTISYCQEHCIRKRDISIILLERTGIRTYLLYFPAVAAFYSLPLIVAGN